LRGASRLLAAVALRPHPHPGWGAVPPPSRPTIPTRKRRTS